MSDEVAENGHSDNGDVTEIELIIRVSIQLCRTLIWGVPKFCHLHVGKLLLVNFL